MARVLCYALYRESKEILAEYSSLDMRATLQKELRSVQGNFKNVSRVQFCNTANGVWYCRTNNETHFKHLLLMSTASASLPGASSLLDQCLRIHAQYPAHSRAKLKLEELLRTYNANKKLETLSGNVVQLEGIIKNSLSKMTYNMTSLEQAERKSQTMADLSMQFELDSKLLRQKQERKKCMLKVVGFGILAAILCLIVFWFWL